MLGLLHDTESPPGSFPGLLNFFEVHPDYQPHEMFDPWFKDLKVYHPPTEPSKALRNLAGGVETNNRWGGVFQVEIVGYAADLWQYPDQWYWNLRDYLRRKSDELSIPYEFHLDGPRLTFDEWKGPISGWWPHGRVPENDHTDPGTLDAKRLTMFTPQELEQISNAVWEHAVKLRDDSMQPGERYNFDSNTLQAVIWGHGEFKEFRLRGFPITMTDETIDKLASAIAKKINQ